MFYIFWLCLFPILNNATITPMLPKTELNFSVRTPVFEGPMELLIDLVEKRKLLINDINLAAVTDEYMQHVASMQERSLPNTAQFISLAATLLLIKSKSLLPVLELTDEEEEKIEDLAERLKLYQIYRNASKTIQSVFGTTRLYASVFVPPTDPLFMTDQYTEADALRDAAHRVLNNLPKNETKPRAAVRKVISLEEMIDSLRQRIEHQLSTKFSDIRREAADKVHVIVGFLAILELVKQGQANVRQTDRYADIDIEKEGSGTPSYY